MKSFAFVLCCLCFCTANAQFKTAGIKTHYPSVNSANLISENTTEYYYGNATNLSVDESGYGRNFNYTAQLYNNRFTPAETYQGGPILSPTVTRAPVVLDATAEFINKTRAGIAKGICYKEVPTSSLVRGSNRDVVGNGTTPEMSQIQVCCDGYERNPHVYTRCDPICADDCPNGICTAPNTCVCVPGHVRNHEDKCISTCPLGCGNGICDELGNCRCKPGYTLERNEGKYCIPECEPACQFGKCVAPNKCECLEGYRLTASGSCEPICDSCENGECRAPGQCTCNAGYSKVNNVCEPVCDRGCQGGRCVAPNTCSCDSGFILDRSGTNCVPHCSTPCLNGICAGANTCTCNPGYVPDEYQRNICKPNCPQGCPNGYCTAPNFCICKPGFIKSGIKGRQTCISVSN